MRLSVRELSINVYNESAASGFIETLQELPDICTQMGLISLTLNPMGIAVDIEVSDGFWT